MADIIKKPDLIHVGGARASLTSVSIPGAVRFIIREGTVERAAIDVPLDNIGQVIMGICKCAGIAVNDTTKREIIR